MAVARPTPPLRATASEPTMIRPILQYGDSAAARAAPPDVTGRSTTACSGSIDDMIETMYAAPGVGLAATQVGVPLRVFVIDLSVGRDPEGLIVMINPEFVERDGMQLEEEGCLSVPGFNATVVRPRARSSRGWTGTAREQTSKARTCSPAPSSTRWIISTASSSSIGCAASSAT